MHKRITIFSPIGGMIVPTKTKKEVLYDMKKQLSILGAVAIAASMTMTAVADDGITLWPNVTTPKVVPQTADLDTYGKHVGRSKLQPVCDAGRVPRGHELQ